MAGNHEVGLSDGLGPVLELEVGVVGTRRSPDFRVVYVGLLLKQVPGDDNSDRF